MDNEKLILEADILLAEEPYRIKVGLWADSFQYYSYVCSLFKNGKKLFANLFRIDKDFPDNYGLQHPHEPLVDENGKSAVLFSAKKWLKQIKPLLKEPDKYKNNFRKLPEEIQKELTIKTYEYINDVESGKSVEFVQYQLMKIINSLILHFEGFSKAGLYLSTSFSYNEVEKTVEYFRNRKILITGFGTHEKIPPLAKLISGHINQDKFDNLLDKLEKKFSTTSNIENSHFKHIGTPYDKGDFVFLIMPFSKEKFDWLGKEDDENSLRHFISQKSDAKCVTVADDKRGKDILDKIYSHLLDCKFAIADIVSLNPNVMYEIGMANSLGKDVIFIYSKEELAKINLDKDTDELFGAFLKNVFDINHKTILEYETEVELRNELEKAIEQTIKTLK